VFLQLRDVRIVDGSVLLDQSMLTGESVAVEIGPSKTAYGGALVRGGGATAEITATGQQTYFGRAAELVRIAHVESGEQKAVLGVVRNLAVFNGGIVVVLVGYAHSIAMPIGQVVPLVLTALLASIPVALPATFTLAAALGAQTLTKRGVLLTRLSAIHEAAAVDVLCADKTGTLTRNELAAVAAAILGLFKLMFSVGVLAVGKYGFGFNAGELQTLAFVTLVFGSQGIIYVIRERKHMWHSRPGIWLMLSSMFDLGIASSLAIIGVLMAPLSPSVVGLVFLAAIAFPWP
jgi:hypothetical protein